MPEVIIKYKNDRTLEALQDFAKYFDYEISIPEGAEKPIGWNGVTLVPSDNSIDPAGLTEIFTGKNIDPLELRKEAWQRK